MVLINNPRTVGEVPLANAHNLQHALQQLAKVMDPEIEVLEDPFSLIITAAARDKQSFGCAHTNEYTYFGDAYFNHELRAEHSFIRAFDKATRAIRAREQREKLTPSEPQIYIGSAIRDRLEQLEQRLDGLRAASAAG